MVSKFQIAMCVAGLAASMSAYAQTAKPPSGSASDGAKDVACLIEGSFTVLGTTSEVKDCMENKGGLTQNQFKQACEGLAQTSAMFGGPAGKVSYMGSCPIGPIAVCDDVPRRGLNSFYYKESLNRSASDLKKSCAGLGGKAR
jgi:hypothetical protein